PRAVTAPMPAYNSIGSEELEAVCKVVEAGRLSEFYGSWGGRFFGGPEGQALGAEWSAAFDVPHSVPVNTATGGLVGAIGACGIGPGDEVIVSPFTMSSSASCVRVFGGTPVFADVDPETFNLDPVSIERCLTPRTRAIVVVDLAGQPADFDAIMDIARARRLPGIAD